MTKILYLGDSGIGTTSEHRARALERLGYLVNIQDAREELLAHQFGANYLEYLNYRTGYRLIQPRMVQWIKQMLSRIAKPDIIWVDGGELLGPQCLQLLQQLKRPMIFYNVDDPTGIRDGRRFDMVHKSLPYYDLCAVVREENISEYQDLGARKVLYVYRSYDEIAHQPFASREEIPIEYQSEVAFIGTWMRHEKRDEFLLELLQQGVPISIWGDRWSKSPHWSALQQVYRGGALSGRNYVAAIQGAKICLGLLSKGNRDKHTQRSQEIPFAGGLFCGERTAEHQRMYHEGSEAVFWSTAAECAIVCQRLLNNDMQREQIRLAGMQRVRAAHAGNEDVCLQILTSLFDTI